MWYSYQASSLCPGIVLKPVIEVPRNGRCPSRASSSSGANLLPCDACPLGVSGSESASHPPASSPWFDILFGVDSCLTLANVLGTPHPSLAGSHYPS